MDALHALMKPMLSPRSAVMRRLVVIAYLLAATLALLIVSQAWGYDDPYITYRYAGNLAKGNGFVYNTGERLQATTTPLFTLLLALAAKAGAEIPFTARLLGALSLAAGGLLLFALGRAWEAPLAGWAGLLLYPTFPLLLTTLGSETPLYLALCLGALVAYARKGYAPAALCAALALLARPDGLLIPALLAADFTLRLARRGERQAFPWRALIVFIAASLPWLLFAWGYFGSPLPVTLAAKQRQGAMAISQGFAAGLLDVARDYSQSWLYRLEGLLAAAGVLWAFSRARRWLLLLVWAALYALAYTLLGVSRYYWYYAPLIPAFAAALGLGVEAAAWALRRASPWLRRGLPAALLLALALGQAAGLAQFRARPDPRLGIYRAAGQWLHANTPAEASVGALEVGVIGYYSARRMVDFAGLLDPLIAAQLGPQSTYEDAALWAVHRYRPDYIVLRRGDFPRLEAQLQSACRVEHVLRGADYGYDGVLRIYACP